MFMKLVLAHNLKFLIRKNDLTVAQLARATKVPAQTLNNWLAGLDPRNMNQVKTVAKYFQVSLDYIAYGEKAKDESNKLDEYKDEIFAGVFEVVLRRKQ